MTTMNPNELNERLILYVLNALSNDEKEEIDALLQQDAVAREQVSTLQTLLARLNTAFATSPPSTLLADARAALKSRLRLEAAPPSFYQRLLFALEAFIPLHAKPASLYQLALTMVLVFILGGLVGYVTFFLSFKLPTLSHSATQGFSKDFAQRALVRTIESLTDSTCRIDFDVLVPQELSGTVHDPRICALLARALAADQPLESRQQAFGILHQTPALLHQPDIRAALIRVVKYDLHTELRHNALNLLLQLPPTAEIGQALLYVLMNDSNAGLRIAAIDALARGIGFSLDALSLSKLRTRLEQDENPYIRTNADALLEELSEPLSLQ